MNILLLIAHGSRNKTANDEIMQLAQRVQQLDDDRFAAVVPAFLEFAEPDIVSGIEECVARGASRITVLPYFLAAGNHVARDIPAVLDLARKAHPGLDIEQTTHLGSAESMAHTILACAK